MKEGAQIDRFRPVIPYPFMGEGPANSTAKEIYVLAKQSQSGYRKLKKPNEPKWNLATVKLQNKAKFLYAVRQDSQGERYLSKQSQNITFSTQKSRIVKKTNPNPRYSAKNTDIQNKANIPFILSKMKLCKTNPKFRQRGSLIKHPAHIFSRGLERLRLAPQGNSIRLFYGHFQTNTWGAVNFVRKSKLLAIILGQKQEMPNFNTNALNNTM
jgi:hypothetical protein